jgi:hypothetical protein
LLSLPSGKKAFSPWIRAGADYQYVIGYYSNWEKAGAWLDRPEGVIANKQRKAKEIEQVSKRGGIP